MVVFRSNLEIKYKTARTQTMRVVLRAGQWSVAEAGREVVGLSPDLSGTNDESELEGFEGRTCTTERHRDIFRPRISACLIPQRRTVVAVVDLELEAAHVVRDNADAARNRAGDENEAPFGFVNDSFEDLADPGLMFGQYQDNLGIPLEEGGLRIGDHSGYSKGLVSFATNCTLFFYFVNGNENGPHGNEGGRSLVRADDDASCIVKAVDFAD